MSKSCCSDDILIMLPSSPLTPSPTSTFLTSLKFKIAQIIPRKQQIPIMAAATSKLRRGVQVELPDRFYAKELMDFNKSIN